MFTFLLEEYKAKVIKRYRLKLATVYLGLGSILLASGFVLAIPSYATLYAKRNASLLEQAATGGASTEKSIPITEEVKVLKEELALVKKTSVQIPIMTILDKALSKKSNGISITGIQLKRGAETGLITLEGNAVSRDALVAFSKSLQNEPSFSKVDLPVSSLAKSKDISWVITISSAF